MKPASRRHVSWWKTMVKAILWTVMALVLLVFGILIYTVKILQPDRLTPIVERVASSVLDADISIDRAELSLRGHYPFLYLDVEGLDVVSRDMLSLPDSVRASLPQYADTLLSVKNISGGVNLLKLTQGVVSLQKLRIDSPRLTIVDVGHGVSNYNIAKTQDLQQPEPDTSATVIPEIEFDSFVLADPHPIRYYNLKDSISAVVDIHTLEVRGTDAPLYSLDFSCDAASDMLEGINLKNIRFGLDGKIHWSKEKPACLGISDFMVELAMLRAKVDASLDFSDTPVVDYLTVDIDPLPVSEVLDILPDDMKRRMGLSAFSTDASVKAYLKLNKPYVIDSGSIPVAEVNISVPACSFTYGKLRIGSFFTDVDIISQGDNLDEAQVIIRDFYVRGHNRGIDLSLNGKLTHLLTDPYFEGKISGNVHLDKLPQSLADYAGGKIGGDITINSDMRVRPSYLNASMFHKLYMKGSVDASDLYFEAADSTALYYARHAQFEFGTSERFVRDTLRTPNMLTASVSVDSAYVRQPDFTVRFTGMKAGVGSVNEKNSADTTRINPVGASFRLGALEMDVPADTSRIRLSEISAMAVVKRYKQADSLPEFDVKLNAGRVSVGNRTSRLMLSKANIDLNAHLNPRRPRISARMKRMADSIRVRYPDISSDSLYAMIRSNTGRRNTHNEDADSMREWIDLSVSGPMAKFLRNWSVRGNVEARRAFVFTPVFPLRNRISDFKIGFTTDSVILYNLKYKAGRSDLNMHGVISDIRRAILSKKHTPIKVKLDIESDTLDVNQIAASFFAGAAYTAHKDSINLVLTDADDDEAIQKQIDELHAGIDSTGPLLIPMNVDADISVRTRNIIYSDLLLHDMSGEVQIYRGALNLNNLSAASDVGAISLSALYSAPEPGDMNFGFGMQAKGFNIERFLKLVPAVDSILPLLGDMGGIINADMAATCDIDPNMDINIPSLKAALKIHGDSLTLLDPETFKTVSKWLFFKNKNRNMIDSMSVEILVENSQLQVFPFSFNFDSYKLGVLGSNDFNMNYNYHVAVLKSPIPFKFGVNITGTPDKMKIRLGGSKFKKGMDVRPISVVDTTRVNLIRQIRNVFRRGVDNARLVPLQVSVRPQATDAARASEVDTLTGVDSLQFINENMMEAPSTPVSDKKKRKRGKSNGKNESQTDNSGLSEQEALPMRES